MILLLYSAFQVIILRFFAKFLLNAATEIRAQPLENLPAPPTSTNQTNSATWLASPRPAGEKLTNQKAVLAGRDQ